MALNLSTLTNSATSADVLAEVLTTADFLEPVPVLRNLSRGSNKGGDAKQDVALNQPRALPLIKNPQGDLGGYLYIPNVTGNYATGPSVTIGSNQTWEGELDMVVTQWGSHLVPMGGGTWSAGFGLVFYTNGVVRLFSKGFPPSTQQQSGVTLGTPFNAKYGFDGTDIYVDIDDTRVYTGTAPSQTSSITHNLELNQQAGIGNVGNYAIQKAKLTVNSSVVFDCDFNGSTSIRHGDTKFNCVGGPVSLTRASNDPATVIKKSVLRFANKSDDSTNIALQGLLNQTVTGGYMFAAFSVLGDGGEDGARVFGINSVGGADTDTSGAVFSIKGGSSKYLRSFFGGAYQTQHELLFDDSLGDILHEQKILNGSQIGKVNNADAEVDSVSTVISAEEFSLGSSHTGSSNPCIDLEFLALFPASITDAQADDVRNYINNRNNVFDLKDGFGYYFYDAQNAPVGAISSGSSSWNGRIVGSDNGDSDRYLTQGATNDAPVGDGFKVTFADNTDHLEWTGGGIAGVMVVGTSIGTFSYRIHSGPTPRQISLLGNVTTQNGESYKQNGSLYGLILLPTEATTKDVQEARQLLIDRGASAGSVGTITSHFRERTDIVVFDNADFSGVTGAAVAWRFTDHMTEFNVGSMPDLTNAYRTWSYCSALESFNTLLPQVTDAREAWHNCSSLSSFGTTEIPNCSNFTSAWQGCSALTSFPAGAKLGTSAVNVNFTSAWRQSGLTSFPALDLSTATNLQSAWRDCDDMLTFGSVQTSSVTNFSDSWLGCDILTSFPVIDTSSGLYFYRTWYSVRSITDFPLLNISSARNFNEAWNLCLALTNFPQGFFDSWSTTNISNGVFNQTWSNCTSLTAQSVENILTSIDASGKYGTATGAAGGGAIDSGIDIDYDGTTLSAATNSAIDSLIGKGWEVYINGVLTIPNVLTLAPAAAYSLRSFDADADPNVVRVRRSTDGALSDFKASEVSDGTLTDWVNTEYETVTNGEFATDSDWTKGTGWSIANGKATSDGTQTNTSYLYQLSNMGASQSQRVTLIVSGYVSGTVKVRLGDSAPASSVTPDLSSNGTYVFSLPSHSAEPYVFLQASSDFQGSIESISVVQLTSDGQVTTWYDQGGTNHATQPLEGYMPKLVDGGTLVTEGGLAAVDFDGTDDFLAKIATFTINGDHMMTAVHTPQVGYLLSIGYNDDESVMFWSDSGNHSRYWLNSSVDQVNSGENVSGQRLTLGEMSSGSQTLYINGTQNSTKSTTYNGGDVPDITIGYAVQRAQGANYLNGKVQELIFFNNNQSANRTGIEANINDTYTIY